VIFAARPRENRKGIVIHSAKPDVFLEWFERYYPSLPKIELNARRARDGWDVWGNEAPDMDSRGGAERAEERVEGNPLPTLHASSEMGGHAPEGESLGPGNVAEPHAVPVKADCDGTSARPASPREPESVSTFDMVGEIPHFLRRVRE
jgi:hypothetical protein